VNGTGTVVVMRSVTCWKTSMSNGDLVPRQIVEILIDDQLIRPGRPRSARCEAPLGLVAGDDDGTGDG